MDWTVLLTACVVAWHMQIRVGKELFSSLCIVLLFLGMMPLWADMYVVLLGSVHAPRTLDDQSVPVSPTCRRLRKSDGWRTEPGDGRKHHVQRGLRKL